MKIYFSGSIRGGRDDAKLYKKLIQVLKSFGEVLTEHIGSTKNNFDLSAYEVHKQDMKWLTDADIVVAEVTIPSHGVGYEIGHAVAMNKKVICLYRSLENQQPSLMIKGSPGIMCYEYSNFAHVKKILRRSLT